MSNPSVLVVKFGVLILPIISYIGMLIALHFETGNGLEFDRVKFASIAFFLPCLLLAGVAFVVFAILRRFKIEKNIQYSIFYLLSLFALYLGYYTAVQTNF